MLEHGSLSKNLVGLLSDRTESLASTMDKTLRRYHRHNGRIALVIHGTLHGE